MPRWSIPLAVVAALLTLPVMALVVFDGPPPPPPVPSAIPAPVVLPKPAARPEPSEETSGLRLVDGTVVDGEGDPVRGATVVAKGGRQRATSGSDGSFRLRGMSLGPVSVTAEANGFADAAVTVPAGKTGEITSLEIRLTPVGPPSGLVLGPDGSPMFNVGVQCDDRDDPSLKTRSNAEGRFTMPAEAVGCTASAHMYHYEPSLGVVLKPGSSNQLQLRAPASIAGTVVDDRGEPIPGAFISIQRFVREGRAGNYPGRTRTDRNGEFTLGGLPAGTYTLLAKARGQGRGTSDEIEVPPERTIDGIEIELGGRPPGP